MGTALRSRGSVGAAEAATETCASRLPPLPLRGRMRVAASHRARRSDATRRRAGWNAPLSSRRHTRRITSKVIAKDEMRGQDVSTLPEAGVAQAHRLLSWTRVFMARLVHSGVIASAARDPRAARETSKQQQIHRCARDDICSLGTTSALSGRHALSQGGNNPFEMTLTRGFGRRSRSQANASGTTRDFPSFRTYPRVCATASFILRTTSA